VGGLGINFPLLLRPQTMFVKYSQAFVCLPAGLAPDELFGGATLVQTKKVTKFRWCCSARSNVGGLYDWLKTTVLDSGKIGTRTSRWCT